MDRFDLGPSYALTVLRKALDQPVAAWFGADPDDLLDRYSLTAAGEAATS